MRAEESAREREAVTMADFLPKGIVDCRKKPFSWLNRRVREETVERQASYWSAACGARGGR